jgi:hypothetical protein
MAKLSAIQKRNAARDAEYADVPSGNAPGGVATKLPKASPKPVAKAPAKAPKAPAVNTVGIEKPTFSSIQDAKGGLKPGYTLGTPAPLTTNALTFNSPKMEDMQAASAMRDRALSTGPSPWLSLELQNQEINKNKMIEAMKGEAAGTQAGARGALMMRGGMNTGARERLASGGARDMMRASQNIYGLMGQQGMDARLQDEATKQDFLKSAAGMEQDLGQFGATGQFNAATQTEANRLAAGQFNNNISQNAAMFNINNKTGNNQSLNDFNLGRYKEDSAAEGAQRNANAIANSGSGSDGNPLNALPGVNNSKVGGYTVPNFSDQWNNPWKAVRDQTGLTQANEFANKMGINKQVKKWGF